MQDNILNLKNTFKKYQIEYMFIGRGAAIMQGFSETTQDIDVYPEKNPRNNNKIADALKELGFIITDEIRNDIVKGKDFIEFNSPFALDLVFAPDGFESYKDALEYKTMCEDFPVMSIEGLIITKRAAGRLKDKMSLYSLESFKNYLDDNK